MPKELWDELEKVATQFYLSNEKSKRIYRRNYRREKRKAN